MIKALLRTLLGLSLALVLAGRANAQVVLTVDYSNLSAVKFTATSNFSAINYGPGAYDFVEGVALLGFLSSPANVQDLDNGVATPGSTLTDSNNTVTSNTRFDRLSSWNDANPGFYPNSGTGVDLTLWNDPGVGDMVFTTSSPAFYGEAIFDLSAYSAYTNLFPALNATGNVSVWNGNGTLGTWQVVGVAVPEPSTYAAVFGAMALLGAGIMRRRRARA